MAPRRSRHLVALLLTTFVGLWSGSAPAWAAATVDEVVDGIDDDGYYVERDAEASASQVDDLVDDLSTSAETVAVVLLGEDVSGGAEDFAGEVFDELIDRDIEVDTLYVVTPVDLGARSSVHDDDDLSAALDAIGSGNIVAELRDVHDALATGEIQGDGDATVDEPGGATPSVDDAPDESDTTDQASTGTAATEGSGDGGGGGGFLVFLAVIAGGVGLIWFLGRRRSKRRQQANLDAARAEAREQLTAVGEAIYDLNDRLTISDREDLKERFATATAEFNDVTDGVKDATTGPQMADLHVRLDRLRWEISAIEAELDGKPVPPEPTIVVPVPSPTDRHETRTPSSRDTADSGRSGRSATCFFDPTHRAATTSAWITSDGGREVEVRVCRSCAQRLERGERPDIRSIDVDGARVPAPRAPGGYGGQGYDLPDSFDIRVDGMDRGLPIDLGPRPQRRRRRGGGGLSDILSGGLGGVILGGGRGDGLPRGSRSTRRRDTGASAGRRRPTGGSAGRSR